jgi:hypothetical protein
MLFIALHCCLPTWPQRDPTNVAVPIAQGHSLKIMGTSRWKKGVADTHQPAQEIWACSVVWHRRVRCPENSCMTSFVGHVDRGWRLGFLNLAFRIDLRQLVFFHLNCCHIALRPAHPAYIKSPLEYKYAFRTFFSVAGPISIRLDVKNVQ